MKDFKSVYNELPTPPEFVDGIKALHKQFADACQEGYKLLAKYICVPAVYARTHQYVICVDFKEEQPENALRGHLVIREYICRFTTIILDYSLLFPNKNRSNSDDILNDKGISFSEIKELKRQRGCVFIRFSSRQGGLCVARKTIGRFPVKHDDGTRGSKLDDLGKPCLTFPDIGALKVMDIPTQLCDITYTLVGKQFYAPLTTADEYYCALYAQIDNEYDENAIQVLRWLPEERTKSIENSTCDENFGDLFFELGYIAKSENYELHRFMIENSNRILFGKIKDSQISLMGGINVFFEHNFKYPACLIKIPTIWEK